MNTHFEIKSQLIAVLILVAGCFIVLRPFLTATILAAVMCISTWPLYTWLLSKLQGRQNIAALMMTLSLALVAIFPVAMMAYSLSDNVTAAYLLIKQLLEFGPPDPPIWLKGVPVVGEAVNTYWNLLASDMNEVTALEKRLLEPAKNYLLSGSLLLGQGVIEMSLAAFVCFFLYRDGAALVNFATQVMQKMVGAHVENVLGIIQNTVRGVMYGILGTALAQGFVATIGFFIAGVPAALLLGAGTALLSLIPVGPPIIWGSAVLWLFYQGSVGWGVFMLFWGFFLISSVDNIVKPYLISRSSKLPFVLVLFGVLGGVLAFGFVGIFIGPIFLAVGFSLSKEFMLR
ncbi:MAG: AI-2E family transporter [Gallionellaceae bacterium]|jgi:predicted PurR-regulated permease PerM